MEAFWGAPLAAIRGQGLILFSAIDEEEIVFPQDGRFRRLGLPAEAVFQRVLQDPDEYLMPRYAPFEELPDHWEQFSGDNYLGVQQHRQEELEQVEDLDDEKENMDRTKASSQDVDAMSSASQHIAKRDDSITDDRRLLDIGSSSSFVATIGLQDSAMPDASPAKFLPILESATTSEVQKPRTSDQVDGLDP